MLDSYAKVSDLEKTARIWSRPSMGGAVPAGTHDESWASKFQGTPFLSKAKAIEKEASGDRVRDAERSVEHALLRVESAKFEQRIAGLEQKLTDWSFSQEGKDKVAFAEKLAECRYRSFKDWSDYFKGSPFYKTAMVLEVEDAQREVEDRRRSAANTSRWITDEKIGVKRAELESELASWRLEKMGFSKTAAVKLANTIPEDHQIMSLPEHAIAAFYDEIEKIEKVASAVADAAKPMSRRAIAALAGAGGVAGGVTVAAPTGHHVGKKKGRKQGVRVGYVHGAKRGYRAGAQRGYRAGQISVVRRIRAMQASNKGTTPPKSGKK
jgi:hypothetical protein